MQTISSYRRYLEGSLRGTRPQNSGKSGRCVPSLLIDVPAVVDADRQYTAGGSELPVKPPLSREGYRDLPINLGHRIIRVSPERG